MLRRRHRGQAGPGYIIEPDGDGTNFVVTDTWTATTREAFLASAPERLELTLNYARGFREPSLDFLIGLPIRRLMVLSRTLTDVSPIYSLAETLEGLSVEAGERVKVAMDRLPRLRSVFAVWDSLVDSIEAGAQLRRFGTTGYQARDLTALANSTELRRIVLKMAPGLESLDRITEFGSLEDVWIQGAPRLHDSSDLRGVGRRLVSLRLEGCPRLDSLADFGGLTGLGMLEVADCGPVESLRPLEPLTALEKFYAWGSTQVGDNDLSPLTRLPRLTEVRMRDRPGYRPPLGEFVDLKTLRVRGCGST